MNKLLFLIICYFSLQSTFSQIQQYAGTIKGSVVDSSKNIPLKYATISLFEDKKLKPLKNVLTKEDGTFLISQLPIKSFSVSISCVGFKTKIISIATIPATKTPLLNLGLVYLSPSSSQLNEVMVNVSKPLVRQEVDRISYDVASDPEKEALNALDMLRKVPLISVDGMDNIKLKGSGNYRILINGKTSAMVAKNPSDVFKSMPASNIVKIEVITIPPAKYDAEGLSGIINIITKKAADQGYNGNVSVRYNTVNGPGVNLNGTVKQGKFGFSGYMGNSVQGKQTAGTGSTNTTGNPVSSILTQDGLRTADNKNTYGSAELSFEIDSLNLLTGTIEHSEGSNDQNDNQLSTQLNEDHSLNQLFRLVNQTNNDNHSTDLGVNYQLGFKTNKDRLLTVSYKYNSSGGKQNIEGAYAEQINYNHPDYRQYNNSGTNEQTIQMDYVHPLKKINIEMGVKAILRDNYSDFQNDRLSTNGQYITDAAQTNRFNYQQNVYSIYNSYQFNLKKWVAKAGLRLERTEVKSDVTSVERYADQSYTDFIPSISLQYKMNKKNSFNAGYTERIQRPGIWQLNPFVDKSNPKFISSGNPDLSPVISHSLELNYSNFSKGTVTFGLTYSFANNTVENVIGINADTVLSSTYLNVGKNRGLGVLVNANYPVTKKLSMNVNAMLLHIWLTGSSDGQLYTNNGFQGNIFGNSSYKFGKGYSMGFDLGFDSRYVMLQGRDNYFIYTSLSGTKSLLKKKATISISTSNPFRKFIKIDFYSASNYFSQSNYYDVFYRRFNVRVNYKFGKLKSSIKKNQRGITNDDTSTNRNSLP
ncbi:TonB-dependent receptor domain-containing protein [Arcticibacter eurypsychrophilus]|uniref:TonB-dependent receptor domain-containing protein n=1 Tax=Arcticibacter eurypsychrophilus TaxID=1434752 RepID=UPI00084D434A|nr:TonB-dependent receptor [Arcticibacter eurypsychrophilus]